MIRSFDEEFCKSGGGGNPVREQAAGGGGGRGRSLRAASNCGRSLETDRASLLNGPNTAANHGAAVFAPNEEALNLLMNRHSEVRPAFSGAHRRKRHVQLSRTHL